jgi:DNA-binding Xre family transcriptional regulator
MAIKLNATALWELQGQTSETEYAEKLGVSRTQLWRVKTGKPVGQKFIAKFKTLYPEKKIEDYFIIGQAS